MLTRHPEIEHTDIPEPHILTAEESLAMRERLAQKHFGMTLEGFTKAWKAGDFDDDHERHGKVISLAMLLPEYWQDG